ncbi:rifin PIR protein,putative [Plasmodium sp. DRC-Itaito]|nr:rifin PIR protein,putative [Plasmodium sp. DRC-Itaito]
MKIHYINIFLFALPLNILAHNKNKPSITPHTKTNRSLCECDLYMPNYDNDPEMKEVMENFNRQASQRFHKYEERMKTTRQKCKDQCDKEIQKIILKDKLEKELTEKFSTLQTDIQNDAIPTCVCEKSLADKTEKFCLKCGKTMGAVAPGWGLVCGVGYVGWTNYVTQTAIQKGIQAGIEAAIDGLKGFSGLDNLISISQIKNFVTATNYSNKTSFITFIKQVKNTNCVEEAIRTQPFCHLSSMGGEGILCKRASGIAETAERIAKLTEKGILAKGSSKTSSLTTGITASIIAIVVIVLIMVIIYLILRYRRKKKMKKKLQYIKLLEE